MHAQQQQQQQVATIVMGLLRDPSLAERFPRLSSELHRARLGHPSAGMRAVLQLLGRLDVVGQPRLRLAADLPQLVPGVTVAVMKNRAAPVLALALDEHVVCAKVARVEPYPLDPDGVSAEAVAVHLADDDVQPGMAPLTWATLLAIVALPDGRPVPGPLRWDYAMEHRTA